MSYHIHPENVLDWIYKLCKTLLQLQSAFETERGAMIFSDNQ